MQKNFLLASAILAFSLQAAAQTTATNYKGVGNGNPISGSVFCADPTALDYEGRLYVYGSNDHQQFIKNGKKGDNGYGDIKSLVVFSTDDMVNWTFHGTIDVNKLCSSWGWQFAASWAPSAVWRKHPTSGKDEFFIYFANSAGSVGVLKGYSPIGPFTSPLSAPMINGNSSGVSPCKWCFDPGAVVDENGVGWISFGGGGHDQGDSHGTNLQPDNACIAKLKTDMIHLDGRAVKIPAPYHFEANELNIINNRFVYTYCTHFGTHDQWNTYDKRGSYSAPGGGIMCYMVGDDPLAPQDWDYKGEYGPHPGTSGNNHSHLHKFQGKYYHIYHSGALLEGMKSKGAISGAGGYRSICVNAATVNENTQTISRVSLNNTGVNSIKNLNPYDLQQAETMSCSGGVMYEDFKNVKANSSRSALGNDASLNLYVKMAQNSWISVRKVDFGTEGAKSFMFRAKGSGKLEIRVNSISASSIKATAEFTSSTNNFEDHVIEVDPEVFKGIKSNIFFVFSESTNAQFDAWQFYEENLTKVQDVQTQPSGNKKKGIFDLNGRRLQNSSKKHGIIIENGKKVIR